MASSISIGTVKSELKSFATTATSIATEISGIETNFVAAMQGIWSTKLAADTVDSLVNATNDYVRQLNLKLPEAIQDFTNGVNKMLIEQNLNEISAPDIEPMQEISRVWEVDNETFNLPSDGSEVNDLCKSGFTANVESIVDKIGDMKANAINAKDNGLAGGYVNDVVTAMNSLLDSGIEVISSYNSTAVTNAIEADTLAQTEKGR